MKRFWCRVRIVIVFEHEPVLLSEVVQLVVSARPRFIVDCTAGGGGHSSALLAACPKASLLAIDRDPNAVAALRERLAPHGGRVEVAHARFSDIEPLLAERSMTRPDAVIADLGVSSPQLDAAARGFSFRADAPLDMRMDPEQGVPARELLARMPVSELAAAIRELGEERHAKRVARAIVEKRPQTTFELAELVRRLVPKSRDGLDPATRTFQAIRMLVNDELGELERWLDAVPRVLADGGVAVVISFHSKEDRAVKHTWRAQARGCICPPGLPVCACGREPTLAVITKKPTRPSADEVRRNPRASSSKLRAARRLPRVA